MLRSVFVLCQALEADLRKKIGGVHKLCEQARGNLKDFSSQRKQLEDYISQMSDWLKSIEESLISTTTGSDPEDIYSVKVKSGCSFRGRSGTRSDASAVGCL